MNNTFGASRLLKLAWILLLIGSTFLCLLMRSGKDAVLTYAFLTAFSIFMYHCFWPRPIHFDANGIRQRDWLGRTRHIPWQAVDSLGHVGDEGKTIVGGCDVEIVHTSFHQEKELFCKLIEQRTGVKVSMGFL